MDTYEIDGNRYPRVTTILKRTELPSEVERLKQWAEREDAKEEGSSERIRQEGSDRGDKFHKYISAWCRPLIGASRDVILERMDVLADNPYGKQTRRWIKKHLEEIILVEQRVHSELGYAGTLDLVVKEVDGVYAIWDWKTARKRRRKDWVMNYRLQCAAYAQAYMEQYRADTGIRIERTRIILAVEGGTHASQFVDEKYSLYENIEWFKDRLNQYLREQNYQYF